MPTSIQSSSVFLLLQLLAQRIIKLFFQVLEKKKAILGKKTDILFTSSKNDVDSSLLVTQLDRHLGIAHMKFLLTCQSQLVKTWEVF